MPVLQVAGRPVYVERRGQGDPLLLIQGMAGSHQLWGERFLDRLATRFAVITFDHRGIGSSADVPGPMTTADLAADALGVLDALAVPTAHVLGISLGGMVAQRVVLAAPDRVRGLVLGCTYAGGPGSTLSAPGPMRMLAGYQSGNVDTALQAAYAANLSPAFRADPAHYAPFRAAALAVPAPIHVILRQLQAAYRHSAAAELSAVGSPTLVVHGQADEMLDPANGAQVAALIPGARLHPLDEVGHLFWWERPDKSADLVLTHLESID